MFDRKFLSRSTSLAQNNFPNKIIFTDVGGTERNSSLRRFHKLLEQIPRRLLIRQPFGVPLHRQPKWMIGQLHRFDQPIRRVTRHAQRGRDILESLMVMAVDSHDRLAKHIGEARAFLDLHLMNQDMPQVAGVGVIESIRELVGEMRVQRPAERDVNELASAADTEERFAIVNDGTRQLQFERVALRLHVRDAGMRVAGEIVEGNVTAAGEENPIEAVVQRVPAILRNERGDEDRHAASLHHRVGIRLLKHDARLTEFVVRKMSGNSDERFHVPDCKSKRPHRF